MTTERSEVWDAESFNRAAKLFLDSGEATTPENALGLLERFKLCIIVGGEIRISATLQAALLTIANSACRSFLGGVRVVLPEGDIPLVIPVPGCSDMSAALRSVGGRIISSNDIDDAPTLLLGTPATANRGTISLRVTFDRWTAGVCPEKQNLRLQEREGCVIAGVLAGALAVSEVFQHLRGRNGLAARRTVAISIFNPSERIDWGKPRNEPELTVAPDRFWLIGLGNLGQAYLWCIGFLPYSSPEEVRLVLQDFDLVSRANLSTSLLTHEGIIGVYKTRAMADWAMRRGFSQRIVERKFGRNFQVDDGEPKLALCGLDNAVGRRALLEVGFALVFEAGLGTAERYLSIDTHLLPGARTPDQIWSAQRAAINSDALLERPGYVSLLKRGADQCGILTLANRAVGVPFVGAVAAALVIGNTLRFLLDAQPLHQVSLNLSSPEDVEVFSCDRNPVAVNPGYQKLAISHTL
jgi:hypothetical protein